MEYSLQRLKDLRLEKKKTLQIMMDNEDNHPIVLKYLISLDKNIKEITDYRKKISRFKYRNSPRGIQKARERNLRAYYKKRNKELTKSPKAEHH